MGREVIRSRTMRDTLSKALASATDVPPNFITRVITFSIADCRLPIADCRLLIADCMGTSRSFQSAIGNRQSAIKKAGREQTRPTSCWKSWSRALQQRAKPSVVALHLLGDSPADLAAATNSCSSRNDTDEFRRPTPFDIRKFSLATTDIYSWRSRLYILFKDQN